MTKRTDYRATFNSDAELKYIADGIRNLTLPKSEWTHAGHFAAAIWLLCEEGFEAYRELPDVILAYNVSVGGENSDTDGYHETITQASLMAADSMIEDAGENEALHSIHARLMASDYGRPEWMLKYWSEPCLFSVAARRAWIDPDIMDLPF